MDNCNLLIEDLESGQNCRSAMSGVRTILVAKHSDVATWPTANPSPTTMEENVTVTGSLAMATGKRFFKLFCKDDAGEYQYTGQGEQGSRSQQANLNVYNPGFRKALMGFIAAVQNSELALLVLTNAGEWHLMGDKYRGAFLSDNTATTGKTTTDPNGADMTFLYNTPFSQIIELTDSQVDALCTVNGSVNLAEITAVGESAVTNSGATLTATFTENGETITKVGFRYKAEGSTTWDTASTSNFTSGSAYSKTIAGLTTATDYLYYAFMVIEGQERYSETYAFTTA